MLININQNKKNSGKRISYNKGNKIIMKYNNDNKIYQSFYANNIINTKKKTWEIWLSSTKSKSSSILTQQLY